MALRPLGIGEIVDGAVKLVRLDIRHLAPVAATVFLPVAVLQWWDLLGADLTGATTDGTSMLASIFFMGSGLEGWIFPGSVVLALTALRSFVLYGADHVLFGRGRPSSAQVVRALPGMMAAWLLKLLIIVAATLLAIVPGIVAVTRLAVVESAVISEGAGPWRSIRRSNGLVKGRTFQVLATLTILLVVRLLVGILLNLAGESGVFFDLEPAATRLFIVIVTFVSSVAIWPVAMAAKALVYADLRVRREALDLDLVLRDLRRLPAPITTHRTTHQAEPLWEVRRP